MIEIKICGVTNSDDAAAAAGAGADYLGFVFYSESPRAVTAEDVVGILRDVAAPVRAVGVFVNESPEAVRRITEHCGLHAVQIHGDETADLFADFPFRVWRALRVSSDGCVPDPADWPACRYVVDAFVPGLYGGTGVVADWKRAAEIAALRPVMLAGGLTVENVGEAIRAVRPRGVDVSGGIEAGPGRKDMERLAAFMRRVREMSVQDQAAGDS